MSRIKSIKGIPVSHIRSILKIDENSPSGLTWLVDRRSNVKANTKAGYIDHGKNRSNYRSWKICLTYKKKDHYLRCSRLILLLKNGYLTKEKVVDHIDGNPLNNRVENLRECTISENNSNRKLQKNNTSGRAGIYWNKDMQKWCVAIEYKKKKRYFGHFIEFEEAARVEIEARKKLHGEFRRYQ